MAENEITYEFFPLIRVYKDGKIERFSADPLPPGVDPVTGVRSKDVSITPSDTGVAARLYLPKTTEPQRKLPILIYFHGGGFVAESFSSPMYHPYLNSLVANSQIVAVSVNYRLAPEYPLPTAYEDSWAAVQWVGSHSTGSGPDSWLNQFADFENVFFAGDSAGANIAHNLAIRVGLSNPPGFKLVGIILVHPYFGGAKQIGSETEETMGISNKLWAFASPNKSGADEPEFNPEKDPRVTGLGCKKVLVCVAEKDFLKDRGWGYKKVMEKSGWQGKIEVVEDKDEGHVFHLFKPTHESAVAMMKRVNDFINHP